MKYTQNFILLLTGTQRSRTSHNLELRIMGFDDWALKPAHSPVRQQLSSYFPVHRNPLKVLVKGRSDSVGPG